jgi:hypothetical protein
MSEPGKRIFTATGISSSLDTVLATTLGNYSSRLTNYKKSSNPNLLSEKSLSNNSSKSSSGSSLTLTNNNINNNSANNNVITNQQFPHHQFYSSQISNSSNWNNNLNIRSNSVCSQKVIQVKSDRSIRAKHRIIVSPNCSRVFDSLKFIHINNLSKRISRLILTKCR